MAFWPPNCTPFQDRKIDQGPGRRDLQFKPVGQADGQTGRLMGGGSLRPVGASFPAPTCPVGWGEQNPLALLIFAFPSIPGSWQCSPVFRGLRLACASCSPLSPHPPEAPALIRATVWPGANCHLHPCPLLLPLAPPVAIFHLQDSNGFLRTRDTSDRATGKMQHSTIQDNPKSTKRVAGWNPAPTSGYPHGIRLGGTSACRVPRWHSLPASATKPTPTPFNRR